MFRYCLKNKNLSIKNVRRVFITLTNNIENDNIVNSGYPDIEIPNVTLPDYLAQFLDKYEKFTAIECSQTKRKYTYGDIRTKSTNLAKALRKFLKLENGDVVAIIMRNNPEYPIANLGVLKANLIITPISSVFTPDEIARQLKDSQAKVIITEVDLVSNVKKAVEIASKNYQILTVKTKTDQSLPENTINFHELVNTKIDYPDIQPWDPENTASLPYSSGTTGLPKGVQLSHRNLVSNVMQNNHPYVTVKIDATENFQEVIPMTIPFYHQFGYGAILNSLATFGGKTVTLPKFSRDLYISMLKDYNKMTILYLVPPLVLLLSGHEAVKKEYLSNVRIIFSGAAPLSASDENKMHLKFGQHFKVVQGYGLTETSPVVTSLHLDIMKKEEHYKGSVGRPILNTQIKIVDIDDPKNTPLGPNTSGELLVKGPQVTKGYLNLPEETKKIFTEDGWFRTGDVSHYNEAGFVFITGRFKELIKVKGNAVAPAELEDVIRCFPGVADAAVIGVPHKTSGEVPRAYVVAKSGIDLDIKKLNEFVNEKVAKYKKLSGGIALVNEVPKNAAGKILRRQIKEKFFENGF